MTRVLVVDDKEENVYYLRALLGAHGYDVDSARHGAEALEKAREQQPDLVISDLLMPVMDGYTLLRNWKSDAALQHVPFVVYTATYTDPEDEQLALKLGADAFVLKPTEPEEFLARVRAAQQNALRHDTEPTPAPTEEEGLLQEYSELLIRKLEQRTLQLEEANRRLQEDIAARERVERALRESEERFRQLAENIEDVFWLGDLEARDLCYVSAAYEVVWGYPRTSLHTAERHWLEAVHPEDRERVVDSLRRYASGEWDETYRIVHPDGGVRWIRSRSYPVRDDRGRVYRVAAVSRDVTEYRRLEEQFRHAQKMEAVGRFAGGVAHDFNNLLSVVLSYAGLLLAELPEGAPARQDIEEMKRAGERGAALTRQLLAFSRQQILAPKVLDLRQVVRGMDTMLHRLLGEDIGLSIIAADVKGKVFADPSQIEQVVMNLAINARDAMPRGGKLTIEVCDVDLDASYATVRPDVTPGPHVMLAVTDTGIGMDATVRERAFEPFFTTKERGKGTGLGLSTVFGIVKQSQGHIDVYSEPGLGTTFKVYFPCTGRVVETTPPSSGPGRAVTGTECVLLVEDDDQVRELARAVLQRNGYAVLSAADGVEALELSTRFPGDIQLLLTDVVMPRMRGPELARRLRETRPETRVLYVSGYTENSILHHGTLEPGVSFLQKPITPQALLRKVRETLAE